MVANILRPTVVGKAALAGILDTYGVKGDKAGEVARGKFLSDARKLGWTDREGGLFYPNMVPQLFSKEHPGNRAPDTSGLSVDDVLGFCDEMTTLYGTERFAAMVNNGIVLDTKVKLKSKSKDDIGLIEGRFAGSKPTPEQMAGYFAAVSSNKKHEFLRKWDEASVTQVDASDEA